MISEQASKTASQCRHYAMCKIDFLGTGLCPAGAKKHYVSYYPQGRMDLVAALADGLVPVTVGLVDIAESCTLCGICDRQCHFVTGMRPLSVMRELKEYVAEHVRSGKEILASPEDAVICELRGIVGAPWAANDPAVLLTYSDDPFPLAGRQFPRYVVLPGSEQEVSRIVRLAKESRLPYAVRGNGGSVFGFVFSDGIVIDMNRMKRFEIDTANWCARVEPGVTSFDLQAEVYRRGLRYNAAEPAATVCGNIVCTGTFSTWSNVYGTAADNFIDMEFVDENGTPFRLGDRSAPNMFAFRHEALPAPGICTRAVVKLHPTTDDEEGVLIPFPDLMEAVGLARQLALRRIGLAVAVIGSHYLANFMSPSKDLAAKIKTILPEVLDLHYAVFVIGDRYAREAVEKIAGTVIDQRLFRMLMLGLPRLAGSRCLDMIRSYEGDAPAYSVLCKKELHPLLEAILDPAPRTLAGAVDPDLREFYAALYSRPEMTDMVWLNMFRIVSSRMSRDKHMFAFLIYLPLDDMKLISELIGRFAETADSCGIDHDYGFLTPMDLGKRAILEYDYYIDHTDPDEKLKIAKAMKELEPYLEDLCRTKKGVEWIKYVFGQGCARKEFFLYR